MVTVISVVNFLVKIESKIQNKVFFFHIFDSVLLAKVIIIQ